MSIGETIKTLRKSKGLTQKELAEKANISQNAIYNYENGKSTPNAKILKKIEDALETNLTTIRLLEGVKSAADNVNRQLKIINKTQEFTDKVHKSESLLQTIEILEQNLSSPQCESEKIIKINDIQNKLFNLEDKQLEVIDKLIDVLIEENTKTK
ncbi:transcriptional regulator [Clostridioides difficile]|nr:transcriptional regulator [Clostridioides difficile]